MSVCPHCQQPITPPSEVCDRCGPDRESAFDDGPPTVARTPVIALGWLVVVRGAQPDLSYPLQPGSNVLGRAGTEIDISDQEPPDIALSSRRHAVVRVEGNEVTVEDLASRNGTLVNGTRLPPGERAPLSPGDVLQVGTVQLRFEL